MLNCKRVLFVSGSDTFVEELTDFMYAMEMVKRTTSELTELSATSQTVKRSLPAYTAVK